MSTLFKTVTNALSHEQDTNPVVPFQKPETIEHKIVIEGLELEMFIGILPEEKRNKQRVIIDLELQVVPKSNYEDDINNTVCYASVIQDIENLSNNKHFNLVETFTEEILDTCFMYKGVQKTTISVKKPDIISNTKSVGFSASKTLDRQH